MDYEWQEYEQRPFHVRCHNCGDTEYRPQMELERRGWQLGQIEICGRCDDGYSDYSTTKQSLEVASTD